MSDDVTRDLLGALAEADASAEAPPEVELRLRQKFRSHRRRRTWRRAALWAPLVPVAAAIVLVFMLIHRKPPTESVDRVSIGTAATISSEQPLPPQPVLPDTTTKHVQKTGAARAQQPEEIVTEFFPLMDPAPPFQRGQLLRVELPASAMQMVGLPVREEGLSDPVQADVLVGEEGLPRAIRFVKFDAKGKRDNAQPQGRR